MKSMIKRLSWFVLLVAVVLLFPTVSLAQQKFNSDSTFVTAGNLAFWNTTKTPSLRLQWKDSSIVFVSADDREARLFLGDSLRWTGALAPTEAAKIFFWAIVQVWNESYSKQWTAMAYMQEKLEYYRSELTDQYREAFEQWLRQRAESKKIEK